MTTLYYFSLKPVIDGISVLSEEDVGEKLEAVELNAGEFIDSVIDGGYFSYEGSFTTPGIKMFYVLLQLTIDFAKT